MRSVPVAIAIVFAAALGAYAVPVLLPEVFGLGDPTAVEILQSGRATELNLSDEASGVSITLDRAYADHERVVIQFTIPSVPTDPGQKVPSPLTTHGTLQLTDATGATLRVVRGQESPVIRDARWSGQPLIGVYTFEAPAPIAGEDRLALQLTIAELRGVPAAPSGDPVTWVRGPWRFDFEVPVSR